MLKHEILETIKSLLDNRMKTSLDAMDAAKKSANEESKSSAGDKYETARAMGQLDREMHGRMFEQAQQERYFMDKIDPERKYEQVNIGSFVKTNFGQFFISVGLGIVEIKGEKIMLISPQSPIGQALMGKSEGENFMFRNNQYQILLIQ